MTSGSSRVSHSSSVSKWPTPSEILSTSRVGCVNASAPGKSQLVRATRVRPEAGRVALVAHVANEQLVIRVAQVQAALEVAEVQHA